MVHLICGFRTERLTQLRTIHIQQSDCLTNFFRLKHISVSVNNSYQSRCLSARYGLSSAHPRQA